MSRCVLITALAMVMVACGSGGATSSSATVTPAATATPAATPTPVATATPAAAPPPAASTATASQSTAVAEALFPIANGQYGECDQGLDQTSNCPFDTRLSQQIALYATNYHRLCPSGCGGAYLLLRQQCGPFPQEHVSVATNPAIAIVALNGNTCLGGTWTMYVSVVVEQGRPLADDVYCQADDSKYGMYNPDPNATSGLPCA